VLSGKYICRSLDGALCVIGGSTRRCRGRYQTLPGCGNSRFI